MNTVFSRKFLYAAAMAAVLGAAAPLTAGSPQARRISPVHLFSGTGPSWQGNRPGKDFKGNGPREVARRQRQIARGQLHPVFPADYIDVMKEAA